MTLTFTDARVLSAHELNRLAAAVAGTYVFPSDAGGAVTSNSNMAPSVAAITARKVIVNGTLDTTGYGGGTQTVAAADATNPRRDLIWYDGAGAIGITAGTAAAFPVLPTLAVGRIAIAEIYVAANDTSIDSGDIIDRRANIAGRIGMTLVGSSTTPTSTTSTTAVDVVTVSGLNIPVSSWILVRVTARKQALAATNALFGIKLNSTVVREATVGTGTGVPTTSLTNRAEAGWVEFLIPPRETANYGFGLTLRYNFFTTTGAQATSDWNDAATAVLPPNMSAVPPQAAVTAVAIRAINNTSSVAAEIGSVEVYELTGS